MAITAADINNQSFSIDRKGYDVDEVDEFLEFVANEIDILNETVAELQQRLAEAEAAAEARAAEVEELQAQAAAEAEQPEEVEEDFVDEDEPEEAYEEYEEDDVIAEMEARIEELEAELAEKAANDSAIAQALIIAQRTAEETIAKANDDAEQIKVDARGEASRIIEGANSEKEDIEREIAQLSQDCDDIRMRFQGVLTDFINDATTKLADISDASIMASAHARTNKAAARNYETPVVAGYAEPVPAAVDYSTPVFTPSNNVAAAPVAPMAYVGGERDLSGFGDTASDAEFDDLD